MPNFDITSCIYDDKKINKNEIISTNSVPFSQVAATIF